MSNHIYSSVIKKSVQHRKESIKPTSMNNITTNDPLLSGNLTPQTLSLFILALINVYSIL